MQALESAFRTTLLSVASVALLVSTACPAENTCENDLDCAAGQVCAADGTCEEDTTVGPEPEGDPEAVLPETTLDSVPQELSNDDTPTFAFSCDRSTCGFECSLDEAAFASCRSPVEPGTLEDGLHTFAVRAVTGALVDATPAEVSFTIDTQAPSVALTQAPDALTQETTATFAMTCEGECSLSCSIDSEQPQPCTSTFERTALADGPHNFLLQGTDGAGNAAEVSADWVVDTTPPDVLVNGPGVAAVAPSLDISFSSTAIATFECSLDAEAFAPCTSPAALANLTNGSHTFAVVATDEAGNASPPTEVAFTVDAEAPSVVVNTAPVSPSTRVDETVLFSCPEVGCSFECSLDGEGFAPCASPLGLTGLAIGAHALEIRATDVVGNQGTPVTLDWTIERIFVDFAISKGALPGAYCAVANDGTLWCWGQGHPIGFDDGSGSGLELVSQPTQVGIRTDWKDVQLFHHVCARTTADALYCFGQNTDGGVGNGTSTYVADPSLVELVDVSAFSVGGNSACAISNGVAHCWGNIARTNGGVEPEVLLPAPIDAGGFVATRIWSGWDSTAVAGDDNLVRRWGSGDFQVPTIDSQGEVETAWVSEFGACFLRIGSGVYCGELNTFTAASSPVHIPPEELFEMAVMTTNLFCGLSDAGQVRCWLQGSPLESSLPFGIEGAVRIESSQDTICALTTAGTVTCKPFGNTDPTTWSAPND